MASTGEMAEMAKYELERSNLFIGIITKIGKYNIRVYDEWQHAVNRRIPTILLIEEGVEEFQGLENYPTVVKFNRDKPEIAINQVKQKIHSANKPLKLGIINAAAWVLGGIATMDLIGWLASND